MKAMEPASPKPVDAPVPLWAWWAAALVGMSVELIPIGLRLLAGEPPADAFWPSALRALAAIARASLRTTKFDASQLASRVFLPRLSLSPACTCSKEVQVIDAVAAVR